MLKDRKIVVVLPAYNAEKTLQRTYDEIPHDIVDDIILVDDFSRDKTAELAQSLGLHCVRHDQNRGYGANQKTCYAEALRREADIVVMLHPDYQYSPKLIRSMVSLIAEDVYDVVLGSRILGNGALKGGMPVYKYISNRFLTLAQNIMIGQKLSEYHTGYRAFSRDVLLSVPFDRNSDNFIFDNEMLVQCHALKFRIAEVTCPTSYFDEASSISLLPSIRYGLGCLWVSTKYILYRTGLGFAADFRSNRAGN